MGGRYYLTGVQLAMLMQTTEEEIKMGVMQQIMDNQFIGNFEKREWNHYMKKTCACGKCHKADKGVVGGEQNA